MSNYRQAWLESKSKIFRFSDLYAKLAYFCLNKTYYIIIYFFINFPHGMICIALHQSCQMVAQSEIQVYVFMHLLKDTAYPSIYCRAKGNTLNVSQGSM